MKIKGFLFDVDGVLYGSMPQHAKSWLGAFKEKGVALPAKYVYFCEGMPEVKAVIYLADVVNAVLSARDRDDVVNRKRELFNGYKKPRFIKGAKSLLLYLKKNGFKICLVTGSHQLKTIERIAEDFGIARRWIVTGKDIKHGKPHPDPFLMGLKKLRVSPKDAVAIENAPLGILSAKAAGLKCVVLKTGLVPLSDLKKSGADWLFKDCGELLLNLKKKSLLN